MANTAFSAGLVNQRAGKLGSYMTTKLALEDRDREKERQEWADLTEINNALKDPELPDTIRQQLAFHGTELMKKRGMKNAPDLSKAPGYSLSQQLNMVGGAANIGGGAFAQQVGKATGMTLPIPDMTPGELKTKLDYDTDSSRLLAAAKKEEHTAKVRRYDDLIKRVSTPEFQSIDMIQQQNELRDLSELQKDLYGYEWQSSPIVNNAADGPFAGIDRIYKMPAALPNWNQFRGLAEAYRAAVDSDDPMAPIYGTQLVSFMQSNGMGGGGGDTTTKKTTGGGQIAQPGGKTAYDPTKPGTLPGFPGMGSPGGDQFTIPTAKSGKILKAEEDRTLANEAKRLGITLTGLNIEQAKLKIAAAKKAAAGGGKKKGLRLQESNTPDSANKLRSLGFKPYVAGLHANRVVSSLVEREYLVSTGSGYIVKKREGETPESYEAAKKYVSKMVTETNRQYSPSGQASGWKPTKPTNYKAEINKHVKSKGFLEERRLRAKIAEARSAGATDEEIYSTLK